MVSLELQDGRRFIMTNIFSPITIGNITLKNRVGVPPMCTNDGKDGFVTQEHMITYGMYSRNQFGMIVVEATAVAENGIIYENDLRIDDDKYIPGLKALSQRIKHDGTASCIQINHAGRKTFHQDRCVAPSPLPFTTREDTRYKTPRALSLRELSDVVEAFKDGAIRAEKAGFDIIEIHGAHGYLISTFLSKATNKREDEYGGSPENRFRLLKEVIMACKEAVSIPLTVRLSAVDYSEEDDQMADTLLFSKWLKDLDVTFISVSTGGVIADVGYTPTEGYQIPYATEIKEAGLEVGCVGLITRFPHMEQIINNEESDFVFVGRYTITNPLWFLPYNAACNDLKMNYINTVMFNKDKTKRV